MEVDVVSAVLAGVYLEDNGPGLAAAKGRTAALGGEEDVIAAGIGCIHKRGSGEQRGVIGQDILRALDGHEEDRATAAVPVHDAAEEFPTGEGGEGKGQVWGEGTREDVRFLVGHGEDGRVGVEKGDEFANGAPGAACKQDEGEEGCEGEEGLFFCHTGEIIPAWVEMDDLFLL